MEHKTRKAFVFTAWIGMIAFFVIIVLSYSSALSTDSEQNRDWYSFNIHDLVFNNFVSKQSVHADTTLAFQTGQHLSVAVEGLDVRIRSWNSDKLKIEWFFKGSKKIVKDYRFHVSREGDVIKIIGEKESSDWSKWGGFSGKVNIMIPDTVNLEVEAVGGDVRISGIAGTMQVQSIGGDISGARISGRLNAGTSGGDISIKYADVSALTLNTSGGDISASVINDSPIITARSIGGDIRLYLNKDVKADIDAATTGGDVRCYYEDELEGIVKESVIEGKINGGGNRIHLRTSGGDILIASK
ncbi:MAG: DUF4097 domain-containing protein [Chlorobi bacterium]|nr:DUF4097 domain-containing protein [Chlorobiota bacterium]